MWISEQGRRRTEPDGTALVGRGTLPGDPAGVYLAGERRELPVFGPGGYVWRPEEGEQVLQSRETLFNRIVTLTGGRSAEEEVFGSVTTGATTDIEQATRIARAMIAACSPMAARSFAISSGVWWDCSVSIPP